MSDNLTRLEAATVIVYEYVRTRLEKTDTHITFGPDEVYIVWFCKTLQNWKALLSTTLPDGMYYEVTYDGDRQKAYLDAYKKFDNVEVDLRNVTTKRESVHHQHDYHLLQPVSQ